VDALAERMREVQRYDGVTMTAGGEDTEGFRDKEWRISGRASASVRVTR
jgi:hypothetical protein